MSSRRNDPPTAYATPPVIRHRDIACAGRSRVFEPRQGESFEPARAVCGECAHRVECLSWALDTGQEFGMWGGLTPEERDRMRVIPRAVRGRRPGTRNLR
jgi:hypothetical protein